MRLQVGARKVFETGKEKGNERGVADRHDHYCRLLGRRQLHRLSSRLSGPTVSTSMAALIAAKKSEKPLNERRKGWKAL